MTTPMPGRLLAVYGTLRRGDRNHHLLAGAQFRGTGLVAGRLFEVPMSSYRPYAYPALVVDEAQQAHGALGGGRVEVEVVQLPDAAMLAALDELEAFDPDEPDGSEFVRRLVPLVEFTPVPGGPALTQAEVFVYAGDPAQLGAAVPEGRWLPR
jgi:gamma-glutamylcyclotransferase (GGCT)/AIG2-like uncharacterized protein YtfP